MATKQLLKPTQLHNPLRLTRDYLASVLQYLGRLGEVDSEVAAGTVRYVVDGTDEDVLLTLGGMKEAAQALLLAGMTWAAVNWNQIQNAAKERTPVLYPGEEVAPAFWVRLGHVFDAVRRAAGTGVPTPAGWPTWLAALVVEFLQTWNMVGHAKDDRHPWKVTELEAVLQTAGLRTALLTRAFLDLQALNALRTGHFWSGNVVGPFIGWADYLARHLDVVRETFAPADASHRLYLLRTLTGMNFDFAPVVDLLVQYATGPAKTVRAAALPLLGTCANQARPLVEKVLSEGDAPQRHEAVQLLWRLFGREAAQTLRQHAAQESSERVQQTIDRFLATPEESAAEVTQELTAALPPLQVELGEIPLPEETKQGIRASFEHAFKQHLQYYERNLQRWNAPDRPKWMSKPQEPQPVSSRQLGPLFEFVQGRVKDAGQIDPCIRQYAHSKGPFGDWFAPPGVKLIHVVRLAFALGFINAQQVALWWHDVRDLEAYRGRCPEPFGLRELDTAIATLPGCQPGFILKAYLGTNTKYHSFCDWEAQAIWPAFAQSPEVLQGPLGSEPRLLPWRNYGWAEERRNAFKVLALFPRLPPEFIPVLWDLALGEGKTDRQLAQAALATVANKASRILVALQDGRQGVRAVAAEWLGKIGDASAIPALKEAFRKEKQEVVRGAVMMALEACGAEVQEFLDRDTLLAEAEAGLAKKRPRGMEWVPLDSLPALCWQDSGQPVDPRIVQWWLVQSIQQKSAVCGPLVRRYLAMCRPHEAAVLSRFVLTAWIGHDTRTASQEQTAQRARADADRQWATHSQNKYFADYYKNDKGNLYRALFQQYANEFLGSAIEQKGMLALVAAAGDGDCVKLCDQYIRKHFGNRLAQCKGLVEVLAWIRHPLGLQVLLSLANRFRTKAIRQAAEEHVRALAEREGWTIDELADRTIPDAGFERSRNESGVPVGTEALLLLDYGPRKFTVKLNDELQPVITTEESKTVKNLPAAGKQDDADKAKAAKKVFMDAKKTVKEVVKRQTERLYEGLCTQRSWHFENWRRYLADHPIVGRLCVRLAWAAFSEDRLLGLFRPLEDGSLTNEKDQEVTFADDTSIRLAHTCNTPAEAAAAWLRHFEDYDVRPLFAQFGRDTYALPQEKTKETEINDFEGHRLTTFQLRGKATKLGYIRGEAEDGGSFALYRKPFPSLELQAVLTFTGSFLPEQDIPAALESLYFQSIRPDKEAAHSWDPAKLSLGKIPPVLLSECYNDVKQIAAEGTGCDPKWREKSYF